MAAKKTNPTLILGIVAIVFFIMSLRLRQPLMLVASGALLLITYQRFRSNYIAYRKQQTKLKRREGAIEVESSELNDNESVSEKNN